jgi:hypothetical protein
MIAGTPFASFGLVADVWNAIHIALWWWCNARHIGRDGRRVRYSSYYTSFAGLKMRCVGR